MKTVSEKAEIAIAAINNAVSEMRSQMKIQIIDKPAADKLLIAARRKARIAQNAYFNRRPKDKSAHLEQIQEVGTNGIIRDLDKANKELNQTAETYFALMPILKVQNGRK